MSFYVWLISLSILSISFNHTTVCIRNSLLLKSELTFHCMYIPQFLELLPPFDYRDNAAMNMGIQTFLLNPCFQVFGYIPRRGIAGSYGNSIFLIFGGTAVLFSIATTPFSPTRYHRSSSFSHFYSHLSCCLLVFSSHPNR